MSVSIDLLLGSGSILCWSCLKLKFVGWFVEVICKV